MYHHFSKDIDSRLAAFAASPHISKDAKRDVKLIATRIKDADDYADRPQNAYVGFSVKVSGFSRDIKQALRHLEMVLEK